jgi:hypothetical protein
VWESPHWLVVNQGLLTFARLYLRWREEVRAKLAIPHLGLRGHSPAGAPVFEDPNDRKHYLIKRGRALQSDDVVLHRLTIVSRQVCRGARRPPFGHVDRSPKG